MRYHDILKDDMRNGDGLRVVLFVAGCEHKCKGCHNPVTWDVNGGLKFDADALLEICDELEKEWVSGITLSGGDPLHPKNREDVTVLCKCLKKSYPDKTIWMYTGYDYDEVAGLEVMKYVDVLVDGKFVEELADVTYPWAGSRNQTVRKVWFYLTDAPDGSKAIVRKA